MKIASYLLLLFAGLAIGYFLFRGNVKSISHQKQIDSLAAISHFQSMKIKFMKDTLKVIKSEVEEHKAKRLASEKKAEYYRQKYLQARSGTRTIPLNIDSLPKFLMYGDSTISSQDTLIADLKVELQDTKKYLLFVDSAFNQSQYLVLTLQKSDSLHLINERQCMLEQKKEKRKNFWSKAKDVIIKILLTGAGYAAGKIS